MAKLVCDKPDPSEEVAYYTIAGLPGDPRAEISSDPLYGFEYDLTGVTPGSYSIRCSACNSQQCSLPARLDFLLLITPAVPSGLRVL